MWFIALATQAEKFAKRQEQDINQKARPGIRNKTRHFSLKQRKDKGLPT